MHVNCAMVAPGQDPGILSPPVAGVRAGGRLAPQPAGAGHSRHALPRRDSATGRRPPGDVWPRFSRASRPRANAASRAVPDVRVIAYTSAPLAPASGFHPKLLALFERRQLRVPSLAERSDDVAEIALFFLRQHARRIGAVVESDLRAVDEAAAEVPVARRRRRAAERDRACRDLRAGAGARDRCGSSRRRAAAWPLPPDREAWRGGHGRGVARAAPAAGAPMCDQVDPPRTARREQAGRRPPSASVSRLGRFRA